MTSYLNFNVDPEDFNRAIEKLRKAIEQEHQAELETKYIPVEPKKIKQKHSIPFWANNWRKK